MWLDVDSKKIWVMDIRRFNFINGHHVYFIDHSEKPGDFMIVSPIEVDSTTILTPCDEHGVNVHKSYTGYDAMDMLMERLKTELKLEKL